MGAAALGARWIETTLPCHMQGSVLLFADLLYQLAVGGALDDLVELGPVAVDEAISSEDHVVGAPVLATPEHAVLYGDLGTAPSDDLGLHDRPIAHGVVAHERDLLAAVGLEPGDVGALEEVAEELHELLALAHRARVPVTPEAPSADLFEVENLDRDASDRLAPFLRALRLLEPGIVQDLQHLIDPRQELRAGLAGPGPRHERQEGEQQNGDERHAGPNAH